MLPIINCPQLSKPKGDSGKETKLHLWQKWRKNPQEKPDSVPPEKPDFKSQIEVLFPAAFCLFWTVLSKKREKKAQKHILKENVKLYFE